ncbi:outer membrane beta-barrel protein [uncultured Phenylobacterium sp.]|uniref:outer membrane beta-barrel protein n=1 Tax=uncultured Phenylobacterium sp. TaxID=349273 RepID=UPI0025D415D4|nr:outer membrane beta-barrel protein [uncultured Phenylobacterium sp.]
MLLGAACCAPAAEAQVTSDALARGAQSRQIEIHLQGRVEHDTNVARVADGQSPPAGVAKSDTIFAPTADASIVLPFGRQTAFLSGRASYLFHDKNKLLDHSAFNLNGGVGGRIGPCALTLGGGYVRGRSELDNQTLVARVQNINEVRQVSTSASCAQPGGIGVFASVGRSWGDNSLASLQSSNSETDTAGGGISYARPALGAFTLGGSYAKTVYPDRITLTGERDGFESIGVSFSAERELGARIQGAVTVGFSHVEPLQPPPQIPGFPLPRTEFEGLTYAADVRYRASSRLSLRAGLTKNISPTLIEGQSFEIQESYNVGATYQLGSRIQLGLTGRQRESKTRGDVPESLVVSDARTRTAVATLRYRQTRSLSFLVSGHLEKRTADDDVFNYSNERVSFVVDYRF